MPLSASILARLRHQHETIQELIAGLTEAECREEIRQGKWSIASNIAHLTVYQAAFISRLERIAVEDQPAFDRYVAEKDPLFADFQGRPLSFLLEDLQQRRVQIAGMLENMEEAALLRTGTHPLYGSMTVIWWTEFFLLHEAHHLYTIFMLVRTRQAAMRQ